MNDTLNADVNKVVIEVFLKEKCSSKAGAARFEDLGDKLSGRGRVLSVGKEVKKVKRGDEVCFDEGTGKTILVFGKPLKVLSEDEVYKA